MVNTYYGILTKRGDKTFITCADGKMALEDDLIWNGYTLHWLGNEVCARFLQQRDYKKGKPIVIIWPFEKRSMEPFIEIYYGERLRKYFASTFGHIAINVNGEIFNFSHLINENEVISPEEYFYRPALGQFAPHPEKGCFDVTDRDKPYYDKFGRMFMRSTHVLRVRGINTETLRDYFYDRLKKILDAPINPKKPEKYKDFNIFTNNCATIIRDGLREVGFGVIRGVFPRDLFVNCAYHMPKLTKKRDIKVDLFRMKQLKVPEAEYSALSPLMNPLNRIRSRSLHLYCLLLIAFIRLL